MKCACASAVDGWGGYIPPVALPRPAWSDREGGIVVDSCIAEAIWLLWQNDIITRGCCCGHNRVVPSVILDDAMNDSDCAKAVRLLQEHDGRDWEVLQWRLAKTETPKYTAKKL